MQGEKGSRFPEGVKVGGFWAQGLGFGKHLWWQHEARRRPLATSWEGLILGTWAACLGKDSSAMWGAWEHSCAGFPGPLGSGRPEGSAVGTLGFPLSDIQE